MPGIDVVVDRDVALARLLPAHKAEVARRFGAPFWWRAEQVHGARVAWVPGAETKPAGDGLPVVPGVDGLITQAKGELLGIYVADCGAIWLADRRSGAVGLLHSGKKGTELGILATAVAAMRERFGTDPADLVGVLSPCIRPPHYEIDFAEQIVRQAEKAGIGEFRDVGCDTASDPGRFYSYRMEKGMTGRMLALIRCGSLA
ncbi:polyphenol oxidase family protein [Haloferula sargassicola]|uniref:polyphenol oxidase family protein n=1 Tax=Haloferula sargassicola TaxID=490096 RepID=UPI00336530B1